MKKIHAVTLGVVLVILLSIPATAEKSSGGIIDKILEFIRSIIRMVTGEKPTTTTTTTQAPLCTPPMIQVGKGCCLDQNKNGICDKDEVTTTTTTTTTTKPTTTTTTTTTTTKPTTTTTTIIIKCRTNTDCGTSVRLRVCYTDGDIYWVTDIPMCMKPGTPESYCIIKRTGPAGVTGQIVSEKAEDCPGTCNTKTATCLS